MDFITLPPNGHILLTILIGVLAIRFVSNIYRMVTRPPESEYSVGLRKTQIKEPCPHRTAAEEELDSYLDQ